MRIKAFFLSSILIFSFMLVFVASSEQANATCLVSNYNSGKFCNQDPDCPSSYVSGNDCYYNFCDCSQKARQWRCWYDDKDSSKPDCSKTDKKYVRIYYEEKWYEGYVCYSQGTLACDASKGWTCNYASVAPYGTEEYPNVIACNDGKDNDCDGKVDECEPLCQNLKNEHDCGIYPKNCKWCGWTCVGIKDTCPPSCQDTDGTNIYTGGTCYDDSGCKSGCKDTWPPSDYPYTVGEYYCSGRCVVDNKDCPTGYVVHYEKNQAYCTPRECWKDEGESCTNSAECCTGICGDKTSESCSSANPVCQSSKTGMKWAYDPSSCELGR